MPIALLLHPASHFEFPEVPDGEHSPSMIADLFGTDIVCSDECPLTGLILWRDGRAELAETPLNPRATKRVRAAFRKHITVYGSLLVVGGTLLAVRGLAPPQVDETLAKLFLTTLAAEQAAQQRAQDGAP